MEKLGTGQSQVSLSHCLEKVDSVAESQSCFMGWDFRAKAGVG